MKHCWNEEKEKWYETETFGVNRSQCLGCYKEVGQ